VLTLRADGNGTSLGDFNGYSRGQVLVEVPHGWRVTVHCLNVSSTRMSCAIVSNSLSARPAFPGAATPNPTVGLDTGSSATFSFVARRDGTYRIACLVDDEEVGNGMWDALQIGGTQRPTARLLRRVL
jgi:sulfocyanin SoxE-like protein